MKLAMHRNAMAIFLLEIGVIKLSRDFGKSGQAGTANNTPEFCSGFNGWPERYSIVIPPNSSTTWIMGNWLVREKESGDQNGH
jgi:hypothetical protein